MYMHRNIDSCMRIYVCVCLCSLFDSFISFICLSSLIQIWTLLINVAYNFLISKFSFCRNLAVIFGSFSFHVHAGISWPSATVTMDQLFP